MSDRDIRELYTNMCYGSYNSKTRLSETYSHVYQDQRADVVEENRQVAYYQDPMTLKAAKEYFKKQAEQNGEKPSAKQIDAQAREAVAQGFGYEDVYSPEAGKKDVFTANHLTIANTMLSRKDQIRVLNLLDTTYNKKIQDILSPFAGGSSSKSKRKKMEQVMGILNYAAIDIGQLVEALNAQQIGRAKLLNTDFLLNADSGVYNIDKFVTDQQPHAAIVAQTLEGLKDLGVGGTQAGPYESALQLLSNGDISQEGKGDINVDGKLLELKAEAGRIGPEEWPRRETMQETVITAYNSALSNFQVPKNPMKKSKGGMTYINLLQQINDDFPRGVLEQARQEIIVPIVDVLYNKKHMDPTYSSATGSRIVDTFVSGDYMALQRALVHELFRMYQDEKKGTAGAWERLVGINLKQNGAPSIGLFNTPEDIATAFDNDDIKSDNPSIIASGAAAAREYQWQLLTII